MHTTSQLLAVVGVHAVVCAALAPRVTSKTDEHNLQSSSILGKLGPPFTPPTVPTPPPTATVKNPPRNALPSSNPASSLGPRDEPVSFCHHREHQGIYYVQLVTTQKPDELCGGLWDNLQRHEALCPVIANGCEQHATRLPPNEKGEQKYVTSWHFYAPPGCNEGAVESAIWEATSPHVEGLQCTKEDEVQTADPSSVEKRVPIMTYSADPSSVEKRVPITAREDDRPSRDFNDKTDFCHHTPIRSHERTRWNIQLVTSQSSPGLCGGLWDNLQRYNCHVRSPHGCKEHECTKSKDLLEDNGQPQYMTSWHFHTTSDCEEWMVLKAIGFATDPEITGMGCSVEPDD